MTFLIGSIFCITGVVGYDASILFSYYFSSQQLMKNKIFRNFQLSSIINICLNGNGDMACDYFNVQNSNLSVIDSILHIKENYETINSHFKNNSDSLASLNNYYNSMILDITLTGDPQDSPNTAADVISNLEDYTNSLKIAGCMSSCANPLSDQFVQSLNQCYSNFIYLPPSNSLKSTVSSRNCLIIEEYSFLVLLF